MNLPLIYLTVGHGSVAKTHFPPTSEVWDSNHRCYVEKLVVAYR